MLYIPVAVAGQTPVSAKLFLTLVGAVFSGFGIVFIVAARGVAEMARANVAKTKAYYGGRGDFPSKSYIRGFGMFFLVIGVALISGGVYMLLQ
jgi:hypothetical protein